MSHVYITNTTPDGNTISLRCGICGWHGDVPAEQVEFTTNPDGSKDFRFLRATCGDCGASSTWPISGGAAGSGTPELTALQQAFALRLNHDPDHPADTPATGKAAVAELLAQMGGNDAAKWGLGEWEPEATEK